MGNRYQKKSDPGRARNHPTQISGHDGRHNAESNAAFASPPAAIMKLQRTIGNRAVQRLLTQQSLSAGSDAPHATPNLESDIEGARGGGHTLPDSARAYLEPHLGQDFSGVRVHTDSTADTLNRQLAARAFTTGSDIFFRNGEYNPDTSGGRELLVHELTHVVQQSGSDLKRRVIATPDGTATASDTIQRDDERSYEQPQIYYRPLDEQNLTVESIDTGWGEVWTTFVDDDSYFKSLTRGFWYDPRMENGIGKLGAHMVFVDWRDNKFTNAQYLPVLDLQLRFEQRAGHERLVMSPATLSWTPDGGGSMQVVAQYTYGGAKTSESGVREGYHSVMLSFTYANNRSTQSGVEVEVGAEGKGLKAGATASMSTTVGDAALSFTREIVFKSYEWHGATYNVTRLPPKK